MCLQAAGQETTINYHLLPYPPPPICSSQIPSPSKPTSLSFPPSFFPLPPTENNIDMRRDMFWGCGEQKDKGCVRFSIQKCGLETERTHNNQPLNLPFLLPWLKIIVAAVAKPCRNGRQPSRRLWDKAEAVAVVDAAAVEPRIRRRGGRE